MKHLTLLVAMIAMVGVLPAVAAQPCSIHPANGLSDAQLTTLAKLSQAEAEKIAVTKIQGKDAVSIASAELEAEHRCLIWSFDLRVAGKPGIQEVQVDAGDGKILSVKHESASQEAAEASNEKAPTSGK
ncbi:MAG: PepSY domain-containing protein [Pseudomonadota bacterium]|nr:PepSY domain-containing protein [Pseudomonadota bacterium]